MAPLVHYAPAGTTRPACGDQSPSASTTATITAVTCSACRRTIATLQQPTPHGRTN